MGPEQQARVDAAMALGSSAMDLSIAIHKLEGGRVDAAIWAHRAFAAMSDMLLARQYAAARARIGGAVRFLQPIVERAVVDSDPLDVCLRAIMTLAPETATIVLDCARHAATVSRAADRAQLEALVAGGGDA